MKIILALLTLVTFTSLNQEEKSRGILNKSSEKMKQSTSYYAEYRINIKNNLTGVDQNDASKSWVRGDKYYALFGENTILSDGKSNWTIIKEEKTIYKTDIGEDDEIGDPRKFFTIWETGFKHKYGEETILDNEAVHLIYLYPESPGTVDYHTIVVYISEATSELKKLIIRMKDGAVLTIRITRFISNPPMEEDMFMLDKSKYPQYFMIEDS